MIRIEFTKAEGSQNDFVVIDDRNKRYPAHVRASLSVAACHRRKGIGADGVVFIDSHSRYPFAMSFFNPDGSIGSMCGNGGRCAALFAYANGIAPQELAFEAVGREYRAAIDGSTVRLYFPAPEVIKLNGSVSIENKTLACQFADTGAPHAVIFANELGIHNIEALRNLDIATVGAAVRNAQEFGPNGTNANFAFIDANNTVHIRTFEKGVEAETAACGTGTIATALTAALQQNILPPITLLTVTGETLTVGFTAPSGDMREYIQMDGSVKPSLFADGLFFEGRANLVFKGSMEYNPETGELHTSS